MNQKATPVGKKTISYCGVPDTRPQLGDATDNRRKGRA